MSNRKMSADVYAKMVRAFMDNRNATPAMIAEIAGVNRKQVHIALKSGWPSLGLPPLGDAVAAMANPEQVHEMMAALIDQQKQVFASMFGKVPDAPADPAQTPAKTIKQISNQARKEATVRAAEHGMAARMSLANAGKTAAAVGEVADWALAQIASGNFEFPETLRIEHLIMLAKATDITNSALFKALQTEKLTNGEPTDVGNHQILVLMQSASPEQLKHIAATGNLPHDLMSGGGPAGKNVIEATAKSK